MEKFFDGDCTGTKTIREIIEENPGATLDLFTSAGYLMVTPEECASLLRQQPMKMHPGCSECYMELPAQAVLERCALSLAPDENDAKLLHIMTD